MRIAVAADGNNDLAAHVSPHFGRCPFYVVADVQDGQITTVSAVTNPYYSQHVPGAVPGFIQTQGADVIICGGMGARALSMFEQLGIEPVTGAQGTVEQAIHDYLSGSLAGHQPCAHH